MNHYERRGLSRVLALFDRCVASALGAIVCWITIFPNETSAQTPRFDAPTTSWQSNDGQVYRLPAMQPTTANPSTAPLYRLSQLSPPPQAPAQSPAPPSPAFVLATTLKRALQDPNNPLLSTSDGLLDNPQALDSAGTAADDPLSVLESMGPAPRELPGAGHGIDQPLRIGLEEGEDPHAKLYVDNCYPSAMQCAPCHQRIYDEWRVSAHAYAAVSPMFHKFEQAISQISQGTIGTFCMRCHAPVAT